MFTHLHIDSGGKGIIFILIYCCTHLLYVIKVILGLRLQQRCDFTAMSQAERAETPFPEKESRHSDDGTVGKLPSQGQRQRADLLQLFLPFRK